MKNLFNLLKKMSVTLLIAATLIGNIKTCIFPYFLYKISTLSEDDCIYYNKDTAK